MADLTTLENVKSYAQITDNASDTVLARLITAVSAWFINQVNRGALLSADYTEQRNGKGGKTLTAKQYPITAISSLTIDGLTVPVSDGMLPGFVFDDFSVFLNGCYKFNRGFGNVSLTYTAGYATVPADVEQAVIAQVLFTFRQKTKLGTTSEQMNGITTVSFSQKDLAPGVQMTVENYKSKAIVQ